MEIKSLVAEIILNTTRMKRPCLRCSKKFITTRSVRVCAKCHEHTDLVSFRGEQFIFGLNFKNMLTTTPNLSEFDR